MRRRNDHGFVTIEFVLGAAFLLLPVTLIVLVLPTWSERQSIARVASREAARSFVVNQDQEQAKQVALQITENGNINPGSVTVDFEGDPAQRGSSVRAIVSVKVPVTAIPILGADADAFTLTSSHTEVVDLYRSQPS